MAEKSFVPQFDKFPSYKGGHTLFLNGYVYEFCPGHHLQNHWGFVPQHRLVAEDKIGHRLRKGECVHHVDEDTTNNSPDNLSVMGRTAHIQMHGRQAATRNLAKIDREQVIAALHGRSLKDAARLLHVDSMTIRNRFPDLLEPRKRKSPVKIDESIVAAVLVDALDRTVSLKQCAARLGVGYVSINRICKRNGVKWLNVQVKGRMNSHYRGKPTQRMLKESGLTPGPENRDKK
jgi:hypothetical protein